jgi:hypothetical protein
VDISIALDIIKKDLITINHFITFLSILITRLDLKTDGTTGWRVCQFKFHASFVLKGAFLGKVQEFSRLKVLQLNAHTVNDRVALGSQNCGIVGNDFGLLTFRKDYTFFVQLF